MNILIAVIAIVIGFIIEKILYKPYLVTPRGFILFLEELKNKNEIAFYTSVGVSLSSEELANMLEE